MALWPDLKQHAPSALQQPAKLATEADVLRTLRDGTYTLPQIYAFCEERTEVARDGGREAIPGHPGDQRWRRRVKMTMNFADLGLAPFLLQALTEEGYSSPTPMQAEAIPVLLQGRDLLGMAQTGTGKTAAFALPLLHRLAADPRPAPKGGARVLVLAPTRELVSQTS